MEMKTGFVPVVVMALFILTMVALPLNASADEIRIDSIGDKQIGKEVTVSGIIIAISNNVEPSKEEDAGIQTFEPGDAGILTIDDGTGTILVSSDPRLVEAFYKGQRVMVTGIYAGKVGDTSLIYADTVDPDVWIGYTDVTVKELKDFPEYYYARSVRIQGEVTRIEIMRNVTELTVKDQTGTMDVEYRAELKTIMVSDEVVVEGKFYRNKIYAFTIRAPVSEPEVTPEPSPSPTPTPAPMPTPALTPVPTSTTSPTPEGEEEGGLPIYLIVAIIAIVAIVGVILFFRVRDWLMIRRYGK
jgi:DNA/RNA endonuclease YhcR with UshA esterase domain